MTMSTYSKTAIREEKKGLRLPDFMIIGAAKSATSTLYECLHRHPDIFMSTPKEPEFFSRNSEYSRGLDWYGGLFEACDDGQVCGEASTTYTRYPLTPNVPKRISRVMPDAKFVYIMRHPVDRAFSHYKHNMRTGVRMTFEEALASREDLYRGWDGRGYLECGKYVQQIKQFLNYFPRDSFLFLLYDDFAASPEAPLEACQRFLGVEVRDLLADGIVHSNMGDGEHYIRHHTTQRLRRLPGSRALADALPPKFRESAFRMVRNSPIGRHLAKKAEVPPMKPETRSELLKYFEKFNQELAEFLGRDLSDWNR